MDKNDLKFTNQSAGNAVKNDIAENEKKYHISCNIRSVAVLILNMLLAHFGVKDDGSNFDYYISKALKPLILKKLNFVWDLKRKIQMKTKSVTYTIHVCVCIYNEFTRSLFSLYTLL